MKKVRFDNITTAAQQPYTKTTHEYYNAMVQEATEAILKSMIPATGYTGKLIILSGCVLSGTNPGVRNITAGWVWYNGQIYKVDAKSFTTTGSQVGVWSISTTADSIAFSDSTSHPVHQEEKFVIANGASGSGLFDELNVTRLTEKYLASVFVEGTFTTSSGDNLVSFNTKIVDTASCFNLTTSRYQPTEPGYYKVDVSVAVYLPSSSVPSTLLILSLRKNGTGVGMGLQSLAQTSLVNDNTWHCMSGARVMFLNGTSDYIDVAISQNNAAGCIYGAEANFSLVSRF